MLNARLFEDWFVSLEIGLARRTVRARLRRLKPIVSWVAFPLLIMSTCGALFVETMCLLDRSERDTARMQAYNLAQCAEIYLEQHGQLPKSLDELVKPPTGRPIMDYLPSDPWGTPYAYLVPGLRNPDSFDVITAGADLVFFTGDDAGNWADSMSSRE